MYGVCVPATWRAGGLALLWRKDVLVQLKSYSRNHIDVDVLSKDTVANWRFIGFYGKADTTRRKEVWNQLVHLSKQTDASWICAGDFNEILCTTEKTGTRRPQWQIDDFRKALAASDLTDLGFQGMKYTWCNRRQNPNTVWARLDRACGNTRCVSKWPNMCVEHRGVSYSNHALLVISWNLDREMSGCKRKQHFQFEAKWLQSEECNQVIEQAWSKLTSTDPNLIVWQKIQEYRSGCLDREAYEEMGRIRQSIEDIRSQETLRWQQRSKMHWITEGDGNTKFFHSYASTRRRMNTIKCLRDETGVMKDSVGDIQGIISHFF
ncbi:UNVERIFIED_CONTAM: hypothetical protein Slati_2130400 [Sesamum latifolium]|uniref:Endonuclease/exonuclease/phosphatase domain-containing protein n=1 Tax=Sesamum latifolium TaxID=2727402 RepID=A0AAW2WU64_9LAMI